MLKSLVSLPQGNVQKSIKLLKIVDIEEENLHIFWTSCRFNEIFKEDMTYNNIKTSQKNRASPFLPKSNFWKNQRRGRCATSVHSKNKSNYRQIAFWKKKHTLGIWTAYVCVCGACWSVELLVEIGIACKACWICPRRNNDIAYNLNNYKIQKHS